MADEMDYLKQVTEQDVTVLIEKNRDYGGSWRKRGGVGAFMMLARKWDRIETQCEKKGYDIFTACEADQRADGILDDVQDLRRYLTLVEAWLLAKKAGKLEEAERIKLQIRKLNGDQERINEQMYNDFVDSGMPARGPFGTGG